MKRTFTSTPPPLDIACVTSSTLRKMDIACVTSFTLRKIDRHPRLDIHKHPPPLGHCPCDVINIPRGVCDRSRSPRTLYIGGFQYQDKFKGGGGDHPCHPPPGSATVTYRIIVPIGQCTQHSVPRTAYLAQRT